MKIEGMGNIETSKQPSKANERIKAVEELFEKYNKNLIKWCEYKLMRRKVIGNNTGLAHDIVQNLYTDFLKNETIVDLSRAPNEIKSYLNFALDSAIGKYINYNHRQKRIPPEKLFPLEGISEDDNEEKESDNLSPEETSTEKDLREYFTDNNRDYRAETENRDLWKKIENALVVLEQKNPKMAAILKKSYLEDKSDVEIAKEYGQAATGVGAFRVRALRKLRGIVLNSLIIPKQNIRK